MFIQLKYACIERIEPGQHESEQFPLGGAKVVFESGAEVYSTPHMTPHYHVIAHRCGYGDDVLAYCFEHEFCHLFVEQEFHGMPSRVLHGLAVGKMLSGKAAAYEENMAQTFQRWLRANERPILSGVNWDDLKDRALKLLDEA
jgi:hypothetical protein